MHVDVVEGKGPQYAVGCFDWFVMKRYTGQ